MDYHYEIQKRYEDGKWHTIYERLTKDGRDLSLEEAKELLLVVTFTRNASDLTGYRIRKVSYEVVE